MLAKEIAKLLENEAAYSHIIELNVGGTKQTSSSRPAASPGQRPRDAR
jgi:hypothetical protein